MEGSSAAAASAASSTSPPSVPSLQALLSAPSIDPFLPLLDDAALARLYGQPPPLSGGGAGAAATSPTSSSLAAVDRALLLSLEAAWKVCLLADSGPTAEGAAASSAPPPLPSALSSFLSFLASLDSAGRQCSVTVPQSLLALLDEGHNPERILTSALSAATHSNDRARGHIAAAHSFEAAITQAMKAAEEQRRTQSQTLAASADAAQSALTTGAGESSGG